LVKVYIDGESKAERKARKALEKSQKTIKTNDEPLPNVARTIPHNDPVKNYVVCLKHGTKYSSKYVNNLYSMVKRHCTLDFDFVCFTEDTSGLNPEIIYKPLPQNLGMSGWWYKPMFFNPDLGLKGTILFFDLDVVIFRNIDNLFTYEQGTFCICKDFNRSVRRDWNRMNSSVFRLQTGQHSNVYTDFIKDPKTAMRRMHGDQDWIFANIKSGFKFWPDEWIQSYKWEMRGRPKMVRNPKTGKRNWQEPGEPNLLPNTNVAVFHGDPNPEDCIDFWVAKNWK